MIITSILIIPIYVLGLLNTGVSLQYETDSPTTDCISLVSGRNLCLQKKMFQGDYFKSCHPCHINWHSEEVFKIVVESTADKHKRPRFFLRRFLINMAVTYSPALLCSTIGH
ncbi:MAG TPA: hypothetical protein PL009_10630, partial [Flavipsychrobacter sp.]|nr:hypothetical protein [Flavipsychrobacter sp.]